MEKIRIFAPRKTIHKLIINCINKSQMKKLFLSLVFVAMSAMTFAQHWTSIGKNSPASPEVKLVSSSEQEVVVDFTLGGFNLTRVNTPNGTQNTVSVPKMAVSLEAGAPNLPHYPIPVLIGDMAEMAVVVKHEDYTDYQVEVAPSKGNISRQVNPDDVPYTYGAMYGQNAFYPATQAHLDAPYILRDFRGQNIVVTPFAYNPVSKTLRVYHHLTISMRKVSDNGENPKTNRKKGAIKVDPETKASYSRRFINFDQSAAKYTYIGDSGEMLVICADQFMEGMQAFVDWKNQSGRPTTMVSVTEAGGNNDNAIKNYISGIYNDPTRNLKFVLFVGDYEHITPHAVGYERSDNWFGQLEGTDRYEEIIIGRFSVQNDAHLATHVNKVLYYERDMPEGLTWTNKGLGIGEIGAGNGHYGEDDYQHIDFIRDTLEHYTYEQVTDLHGGGGGASAAAISNVINSGVSIINYCNHGSETGWAVANYSNSNVNALTNGNRLPFVWSVACLCGKFNYGSECFAEAWMRATDNTTGDPTGAIGGMFSWMSQPWIPPMYGQDEMVNILTEWHNADKYNHTFGGASAHGNMYVMDMSGSSGYDTHDTWILFGDPSLMVRTDNPTSMNLALDPPVLMLGMSQLEINATDTPYGIACLTMDNEVIASGQIHNGTCTLTFNPLNSVGTATLTVMGYNKLTEVIEVQVNPAEGAYVSASNLSPTFAPVNQETLLSLSFKNVGVDPTSGTTTINLSCDDARLTILNGTAEFGVLAADETITLENAFSFIIAEEVEDGTRFQIDYTMTCGDDTWNGKGFVTASRAILDYAGTEWAKAFVPGQTLSLVAKFKNVGHYMATNAIAGIACENEYLTINNETVEVGTIDADGTATCVFQVTVDANCPETEAIPVSFNMTADGGLIAEGSFTLRNSCNVIFNLNDSYGDGWNGNVLVVSFDDGTPAQNLTIQDGYSSSVTMKIGSGVTVSLRMNTSYYVNECSFSITYEDGTVILQASNLSSAWTDQFVCSCASTGEAETYNPVENLNYEVLTEAIVLTWDAPRDASGYKVSRNGIEIGETETPDFTDEVMHEGTYTYCVTALYGDNQSVPECVVIRAEWGIEENEAEFAVYPNPASNTLHVNGGNAEYTYEMFNGMGQMVAKGSGQGTTEINVNGLTKGVYFLRLTSGTQACMEKVVVE